MVTKVVYTVTMGFPLKELREPCYVCISDIGSENYCSIAL